MEEQESAYIESEDEDFNPEATHADEDLSASSSSEEEEEPAQPKTKRGRKRKAEAHDDLDSGDEATIKELKRKKRKAANQDDGDSGGEGGLVKTRAQRRAEKEERREYQRSHKGPVTIDVEALWASLSSAPVGRRAKVIEEIPEERDDGVNVSSDTQNASARALQGVETLEGDFVTIRHSYEFAGQTVSEEKRVHRESAEAKLYMSRQSEKLADTPSLKTGEDGHTLRRPLKRASRFEPNPTGEVKGVPPHKQRLRTPSRADVLAQQQRLEDEAKAFGGKAQRLNTVQKSALDWASHVDAEGLKDELAVYDKSKQGYMAKMDFLQNVQGHRDHEERQARLQQV
ncbi:hypothetical protein CAC42_8193 [Sphaceloma murrayae]|uniref:SWR1-complex protein 5 n=1 Tax=Sphaceloma murrayae TaxID=2082308 RepID=A0A2K1QJW8_9PEZI|nr:hypothetical protein CAC42_8193 [Sphaceloma murrayae]